MTPPAVEPAPWRRALGWVALIGIVFVGGYRATNAAAAAHAVPGPLLPLDAAIPFWAWTLIPYLSLNLLVPVACLLQPTRARLDRLALRLMAAIALCLLVFWCWPTALASPRPEVGMPWAPLYDALRAFDGPHNLVPSLHVAVAMIVWAGLRRQVPAGAWRWAWSGVCGLIVVSTLTTGQHHLVDVLAGLGVGLAMLAIVRDSPG